MIDAEVVRLRHLRDVALWTRALAGSLDTNRRATSVFSRCARASWTIARATSGRLRAHPYVRYQRGASNVQAMIFGFGAALISRIAKHRGRLVSTCLEQMQSLARELDDARAVTWSPDLSDSLGRVQGLVRELLTELEAGARHEQGAPLVATMPSATTAAAGDWPYIAI